MLEAILPLALISVAVLPLVHPVPIGLAVLPLTDVRVAEDAAPHTVAVLDTVAPLAIIHLSVGPQVHTLAMSLPILEVSLVLVAI